MEKELAGQEVGGWRLVKCIGFGKSALVFEATRGSQVGAVKVFDRELIDRFGKDTQRERVLREKSLVGQHHPNLIEILDAGEDETLDLFFVVMALFPGRNIAQALDEIPLNRVHALIAQVASAAEFLEGLDLAHRDIKPENIGVSDDFSTAMLLDLGVLRPVGFSTITDQHDQKTFVGTLQYSPPELLHRIEEDSLEGWRAVSFYQLGGVLHDLLARKPLFSEDLTPYPHLVETISTKKVTIQVPEAAPELCMLARDCLVKNPKERLQLVSWGRFQRELPPAGNIDAIRERIAQRRLSANASEKPQILPARIVNGHAVKELQNKLERILRDSCKQEGLPPFIFHKDDHPTGKVRLLIGPSRTDALNAMFQVYVEGTILQQSDDIVRIAIAVAISSNKGSFPEAPPPPGFTEVFRGVCSDDVIKARLVDVLLFSFDEAQERCAQDLITESPEWLTIPGSE
jgi:serine/threonine-protein kinase